MDVSAVKSHIKKGEFDKFYIFAGEEYAVMRIYIDKIIKTGGYKKIVTDSLTEAYTRIRGKSLISEPSAYIIIDDMDFLKKEDLWKGFNNGAGIKDDIVIFIYHSVDKRLKFWKNFKDSAVFFEPLKKDILIKYMKAEVIMEQDDYESLYEMCEGNYGQALFELDKIRQYMESCEDNEYDISGSEAFHELLSQDMIYSPPKDAIFDFVESVLDRSDFDKIYYLLDQCYKVGEANMVMLSVLYTNFRQLLQVQTCTSDNISKSTGLNGWVIKRMKPYVDRYSDIELMAALSYIRKAESGIKTGDMADDVSVKYVLVNVL